MEKITYTEIFYSLQGEGRWAGVPSVFFRTFGCNFRCKKFGRPNNEDIVGMNPEVVAIADMVKENPTKFTKFEDLPLVTTGCDTYASIYPEFKKFNKQDTVDIIVDNIHSLLPNQQWNQASNDDIHLVITGGEPLLGYQKLYPDLLGLCKSRGLKHLTFETNGTQNIIPDVSRYLQQEITNYGKQYDNLTFSVSPKLPCSGEPWASAINPKIIESYQQLGHTYLKFVVANDRDVEAADQAVSEFRKEGFQGPVYLMPLGGVPSVYNLNTQAVAKLAMARGWRYSPRLQVDIWRNAWGT